MMGGRRRNVWVLLALAAALGSAQAQPGQLPLEEFAQRLAAGETVRIGLYGSSTYAGVWTSDGASGGTKENPGYWMQYFLNSYYLNSAAMVDSGSSVPGSTTADFLPKWQQLMTDYPERDRCSRLGQQRLQCDEARSVP